MNRRDITTLPTRVLRQKAKKVGRVDAQIEKLSADMISATLDWEDHRKYEVGVALAANQVGKLKRVIVVREDYEHKENRKFRVFVNPEILKQDGELVERQEGCLSVKDVYGTVPRYSKVKIRAQTLQGKTVRFTAKGFLARIFQHEIDHLDGILFIDHVKNHQFFKLDQKGELIALSEAEQKNLKL